MSSVPLGGSSSGQPGDLHSVFGLDRVERDPDDPSGAETRREHREAGAVLDFDRAARDTRPRCNR